MEWSGEVSGLHRASVRPELAAGPAALVPSLVLMLIPVFQPQLLGWEL